jgi:DNA-binding LacI/PurR family transcriptional regulator
MGELTRPVGRRPDKQNEILHQLRCQIVSGRLAPGDRLPLRSELQQHFVASTATVQSALNRLIDDGFVEARGRHGTFVAEAPPHLACYGLAFPHPPGAGEFQSRMWTGILNQVAALDLSPQRRFKTFHGVSGHVDGEADQRLIADVSQHRLAGVIFILMEPEQVESCILLAGRGPSVLVNTHGAGNADLPRIEPDIRAFIDMSLDRLKALGRSRVGLLTVSGTQSDHIAHLFKRAAKRGLHVEQRWVQCVAWPEVQWASNAVQAILSGPKRDRPDGLILLDDNATDHAIAGIHAAGVSIPRELEVIAHCNFPAPPACVPLHQLGFDLGRILTVAMECIDQLRSGAPVEAVQAIRPEFRECEQQLAKSL